MLYASAANTLAKLAKNTTATRYLANTGTSNNPNWDQVNLANGVTGTLPTANGGSGQSNFSGNMVLIQSQAASSSTDIQFTSGITSTYKVYFMEFINIVPATDGATLAMTVSTNGGSTYSATGYEDAGRQNSADNAIAGDVHDTAQAQYKVSFIGISNTAANGGLSGFMRLYNLASGSVHKCLVSEICVVDNAATPVCAFVAQVGRWKTTTAVNALKFAMSSGNIASGTFNLYGVV